jgi:putative flippase GtrA
VRRALASGRLPVADIAARIGRRDPAAGTRRQVTRFAAVGVLSTVVHLGLFATLASLLASSQAANVVALLVATLGNTALNRRWTFGIRGPGRLRSQVQGLTVFGLTWLLTAGALALLHAVAPAPSTAVATVVVGAATAASTVVRFVAMRSWIFRTDPQSSLTRNEPSSSSNATTPVRSNPSTEPWQTVTSP